MQDIIEKERSVSEIFELVSAMDDEDVAAILSVARSRQAAHQARFKTPQPEYAFKGKYVSRPLASPEPWPGAHNSAESIVAFLGRVYADWLGYGMTRADLEKIDPSAYLSLRGWERKNGKWTALPTTKEHNGALLKWASQVDEATLKAALPPFEQSRLAKLRIARARVGGDVAEPSLS